MKNILPGQIYILTITFEQNASGFFNAKRQEYFPKEINYIDAHLTLFHYLPITLQEIREALNPIVASTRPFTIEVTNVVSIGKGVAYKLGSAVLQQIHKQLQTAWKPLLKPQDRQKLWPHITIQNKVSPEQARNTLAKLQTDFQPFNLKGIGFTIWEYLGGPWKFIENVCFSLEAHS